MLALRSAALFVVALLFSFTLAKPASADILQTWVEARAGSGEPVHWVSQGGVYSYPSGELLFGMMGFDSSTVVPGNDEDERVVHLTRKTYAYTDPSTGEVLTEYNGKAVAPIAYPYQLITYRLEDGQIHGDVEQGVEPNVQRIKSENGMRITELGDDTLFINAHVFLDIPIGPERRMEAWENYDFFIHRNDAVDEPHQMSWQRYGDLPPWAGKGKAIYHLLSYRVESHDEFPPQLLEWAKKEKPMWLKPPASLDEIRALQRGEVGAGWGRDD